MVNAYSKQDQIGAREKDSGYLAWCRRQPCAHLKFGGCTGEVGARGWSSEASHTKTRGSGGGDDLALPQCTGHHKLLHDLGRKSFEWLFQVDLESLARYYRGGYARTTGRQAHEKGVNP